jgi:purine-cytosine permease-like protein
VSTNYTGATLEAGAAIPAGQGRDVFGRIESRGIDAIPDIERTSKPSSLFAVFFGPQFGLGNMIFGALPIAFGLGWWASVTAIVVGVSLGSLVFLTISPLSPLTGTNTQVSSGIAFGVRGRLLGSAITWFIAIGFIIVLDYTSSEALIQTFGRWFGTSTGTGALSIAIAITLALTAVAAVLGHATLERGIKYINLVGIVVVIALFAVYAPKFHAVHGGHYLLGGFWPTWFLGAATTASLPISWGPFVGDYGRYIPSSTPTRKVCLYGVGGIFLGCLVALLAAAFAATSFPDAADIVGGFVRTSPAWFLLPLLIIPGLASNIASASMSLYNASLDIGAWPGLFRFSRWRITAAFSVLLFGLTYLFAVVLDFMSSLEAFVTIMIVTATPWMVVIGIEFLFSRRSISPADLHAFAVPGARGRYWFTGGVNINAFVAWGCGVALGLMFSSTTLFTGVLVNSVSGVDISWLVAAVVAAVVYVALRRALPAREHGGGSTTAFVPQARRDMGDVPLAEGVG